MGSDAFLSETEAQCAGLDGVVLGSGAGVQTGVPWGPRLKSALLELPSDTGLNTLRHLRGVFRGFVHSDASNQLVLFSDHFARKPLYSARTPLNGWAFSSDLLLLVRLLRLLGAVPRLNESATYSLLTFGYMLGDETLVEGVRKVPPGSICVHGASESRTQYYQVRNEPEVTGDLRRIVSNLDDLFRQAVERQVAKERDVGANHLVTLSGGLDSRTCLAYVLRGTHNDVTCLTFSESDYLDHTIARRIALDRGVAFAFVPLDGGGYLTESLQETVALNGGLVLYSGAAHQYHALRHIDCACYGILHTGQIGDLVLGSYLSGPHHTPPDMATVRKCAYSRLLLGRGTSLTNARLAAYETSEMFAFYERCVNGVFNGDRMTEAFLEPLSPFLDVDFAEYAFRISPRLRYQNGVYREWLRHSMPCMARYAWEKYGASPLLPHVALRAVRLSRIGVGVLRHGRTGKGLSMNPFGYWWTKNGGLQEWMNGQFLDTYALLHDHRELADDADRLFCSGTPLEKTQVLTLLEAVRVMNLR